MAERPVLEFVFFDAGGGHRAAANALKAVIERQRRPWDVRLVSLQEVLDPLDIFRKVTGIRLQEIYNLILARGWTLGAVQGLRLMHGLIRAYHRPAVRMLADHWRESAPHLVVSLVPNFNRALFEGLRQARPETPYVTILTDLADYPPHFWIERQPQYLICGTEHAAQQAYAMGYPKERVFRTSGMILRPGFYEPVEVDRAVERRRLALDPTRPTGLVLFGGLGSKAMLKIARRLQRARADLQLIAIAGHNEDLVRKLTEVSGRFPIHVEGFTTEIPYYMRLADFFVGKPGPGSVSEALAMELPVIVERNAWTLPQERFNADWILENQVGIVLKSFRQIVEGVERMLAPGQLERFRANAAALRNRAVFEVPDILERILTRRP